MSVHAKAPAQCTVVNYISTLHRMSIMYIVIGEIIRHEIDFVSCWCEFPISSCCVIKIFDCRCDSIKYSSSEYFCRTCCVHLLNGQRTHRPKTVSAHWKYHLVALCHHNHNKMRYHQKCVCRALSAFPYLPIASRSLGATPPRCNQHILLHFKTMSIRLCVFHLTTTTMALYKCYYASKVYDCTWEWQCVLEIYFGSPHFLLHFDPIALFVFMVSSFISCSLYLSHISSTVGLSIILCYPVARAQYIS